MTGRLKGKDRVICINIDVDPLRLYRGIHSLPQREEGPEIYTLGVARFIKLCNELGVKATVFAVASDVKGEAARVLREVIEQGHEVASHSMTHPYGLFKNPTSNEIEGSKKALEDALGTEVKGFRSPGYNVSRRLLNALVEHYIYDSSILPSPPYFLARAMVIGFMRLTGRRSASFVGRPGQFFRSWRPFEWRTARGPLLEFPMSATFGLPIIGTTLGSGSTLVDFGVNRLKGREFVNIEFHGIDFLDLNDGIEEELKVEPALRLPLDERMALFRKRLQDLKKDRIPITLAEMVSYLDRN